VEKKEAVFIAAKRWCKYGYVECDYTCLRSLFFLVLIGHDSYKIPIFSPSNHFSTSQLGPGCSVGIATEYGLDGPTIESRWGQDFSPVQTGPGAHPASCTMGAGSFPGVKSGRGVLLTTHPLLAPRSWKSRFVP
jgi:hypothetical protein